MNIRLNLATSCALAACLMATSACAVRGQVPEHVSATQFFAPMVNGHTALQDFETPAGDLNQLKATMGDPISESCETTVVSTDCTVQWNGVTAVFSDVYGDDLLHLTFTSSAAFLDYGGTTIRVGDPISQLQQIFPQAYQNRGDNCPAPAGSSHPCRYGAVVASGDVHGMLFKYNPSTQVIEEIRWTRYIF